MSATNGETSRRVLRNRVAYIARSSPHSAVETSTGRLTKELESDHTDSLVSDETYLGQITLSTRASCNMLYKMIEHIAAVKAQVADAQPLFG